MVICPSTAFQSLYSAAKKVAPTDLDVLLTGERGVGKETLARMIHRHSPRSDRPLFKVLSAPPVPGLDLSNLGGVPMTVSEFHWNRLEAADGCTLLFNEVCRLDAEGQLRLLRLLLNRELASDGGAARTIDVRIMVTSSRDLWPEVAAGRFRNDLFQRLRGVELTLPPLRERPEDVKALARHFLEGVSASGLVEVPLVRPEQLEVLSRLHWPGNVAELRRFLRGLILAGEEFDVAIGRLAAQAPAEEAFQAPLPVVARQAGARVERILITRMLDRTGGDPKEASNRLNISERSLRERMRRHDIRPTEPLAVE